jgi:hypothetical protein
LGWRFSGRVADLCGESRGFRRIRNKSFVGIKIDLIVIDIVERTEFSIDRLRRCGQHD